MSETHVWWFFVYRKKRPFRTEATINWIWDSFFNISKKYKLFIFAVAWVNIKWANIWCCVCSAKWFFHGRRFFLTANIIKLNNYIQSRQACKVRFLVKSRIKFRLKSAVNWFLWKKCGLVQGNFSNITFFCNCNLWNFQVVNSWFERSSSVLSVIKTSFPANYLNIFSKSMIVMTLMVNIFDIFDSRISIFSSLQ